MRTKPNGEKYGYQLHATTQISVVMPTSEAKKIRSEAEANDESVSEAIRRLVRKGMEK